jgi:hypothetical protein
MSLDEYMENQENLPEFLKDFHDQKDFFKSIFNQYKDSNAKETLQNINRVDAHIFTIDVFLWWMGRHGYKLQKSRKKGVVFLNPYDTINYYTNNNKLDYLKDIFTNDKPDYKR